MYSLEVSPAFKLSLDRLTSFLERKYSPEIARQTKKQIKFKAKSVLSERPFSVPVSPRLLEMGIDSYRQLIVDDHNLVFYRINEEKRVVSLLAVMDSRQSIESLLYEVMISL
jgi:toxin ParE1/3/4